MPASSVQRREIPVSELDLDCENPRHGAVADQKAALEQLIADQREKIGRIAEDFHENGLSPAQLFIVTNSPAGRYIVLDGNRRLAALRILEDPDLLPPEFRPSRLIERVSEPGSQPSQVMCAIVANRDEARLWLDRTHSGQLDGVGTVSWSAVAKHRFNPVLPGRSHTASAMTVLDWLRRRLPADHATRPHLDTVEAKSVTNLGRLASDPDIRKVIGFDFQGGIVTLNDDEAAVVQRLLTIVEKLATGTTVTALKGKNDRAAFVAEHLDEDRTRAAQDSIGQERDPSTDPSDSAAAASADGSGGAATAGAGTGTTSSRSRSASHPFADIDIEPLHPRIQQVIVEVRSLDPDRYPNAMAVLLRVIFELTVTEYLDRKGARPAQNETLATNIRTALRRLDVAEDDSRFHPIQTQLKQRHSIISVSNLHQYVHNPDAAPGRSDLNSIALAYRPLLEAICSNLRERPSRSL